MSFIRNKNFWYYFLIVAIIAGGIFIRFWHLNIIPPGIHYDEAYNGIDALNANEHHDWQIFYSDNSGREGLHLNAIALSIKIFGNTSFGLRFANALWGSLTLIGFFFLLRELKFSRLSVAIGTFMLATSFWHLLFSRTAFRAIMVPLVIVWMMYFFWKALNATNQRYKIYYFVISGIILGIGFHTYIAFRIAPLIIVLVALSLAITRKGFVKKYWKYAAFFTLAGLLMALPIFIYFSDHFHDFIYRSAIVSVFNAPRGMTFWQAFTTSLSTHLLAFFSIGDHNPRHNYSNQPLLPSAWSVLFAIGFIISLREIVKTLIDLAKNYKKNNAEGRCHPTRWFYVSVLAQSIFWVMIMPGALTIEGIPHSMRIIGTIPGVFILCALPFEYMLSIFSSGKNSSLSAFNPFQKSQYMTIFIGLIALVVLGGALQVYTYFGLWANDMATMGAYERKIYDFGQMIRGLPIHRHNYVITAWNTLVYPDHRQSSLKTAEFLAYPNIKQYLFYKPLDGYSQISCDDPQVVLLESDQWLRNQYKSQCPGLKNTKYTYDNGKYTFWVMTY